MRLAFMSAESRQACLCGIVHTRVGDMGLKYEIWRDGLRVGMKYHTHEERLPVRVGEEMLLDDEAAARIPVHHAIRRGERPAALILMQVRGLRLQTFGFQHEIVAHAHRE